MSRCYLAHHGIIGQKWGVRRYQNPDGTLTAEGKEHYDSLNRTQKEGFNRLTRVYNKASKQNNYMEAQYGYNKKSNVTRDLKSSIEKNKKNAIAYLENKENIKKINKIISDPTKTESYGKINKGKAITTAILGVSAVSAVAGTIGYKVSKLNSSDWISSDATKISRYLGVLGVSMVGSLAAGKGLRKAMNAIGDSGVRKELKNEK